MGENGGNQNLWLRAIGPGEKVHDLSLHSFEGVRCDNQGCCLPCRHCFRVV